MSKEIDRLKQSAEVAASTRIREELQKMSGKELGQALYHATTPGSAVSQSMRGDIVSECMHRLAQKGP